MCCMTWSAKGFASGSGVVFPGHTTHSEAHAAVVGGVTAKEQLIDLHPSADA